MPVLIRFAVINGLNAYPLVIVAYQRRLIGMLILTGGRERSASEYHELLAEADFEVEEIIPTAGFSILLAKRR